MSPESPGPNLIRGLRQLRDLMKRRFTEKTDVLTAQRRLLEEISIGMGNAMDRTGTNLQDLSIQTGIAQPELAKMLGGCYDYSLYQLAKVFHHLGRTVHITLSPMNDPIREPIDEVKPCKPTPT